MIVFLSDAWYIEGVPGGYSKNKVSLKSKMAGAFSRNDTIINKHFIYVGLDK